MLYNKLKTFAFKKKRFNDKLEFFNALHGADRQAIQFLAKEITYKLRQAAFKARLQTEDVEELINDAVVITISNIREGKMQFMDFSPVAYATGVGRKLIANRFRTKKPPMESLENVQLSSSFDPERYLKDKEQEHLIGRLLAQLGDNCRLLIQLKFFEQLKDKEIINQKKTPYNSVDTLKSKRSQCMKKLSQLVQQAGGKELIDY